MKKTFLLLMMLGIASPAFALKIDRVRSMWDIETFKTRYKEIAKKIVEVHILPGLKEDYVPQGITKIDDDRVLVSLYYKKKNASPKPSLFALQSITMGGVKGWVQLNDENGNEFYGHVGGVTRMGKFIWTVSGGKLYRYSRQEILNAERGAKINAKAKFNVDSKASYISSDANALYIGDFAAGKKFRTPDHHHGKKKKAWIAQYIFDYHTGEPKNTTYEVDGKKVLKPERVIFIRQKVQGMAVYFKRNAKRFRSRIALSVSFGSKSSKLAIYNNPLDHRGSSFQVKLPGGHTIPGYVLNDHNHIKTIPMPPGSEDLDWDGSNLYTAFEAGANPYRKRWRDKGAVIESRFYQLSTP